MLDHEEELRKIFKDSNTPIYSKLDVKGYKIKSENLDFANWFGDSIDGDRSVMFFAFVPKENMEMIFDRVRAFNDQDDRVFPLHAFQMPVEKFT